MQGLSSLSEHWFEDIMFGLYEDTLSRGAGTAECTLAVCLGAVGRLGWPVDDQPAKEWQKSKAW